MDVIVVILQGSSREGQTDTEAAWRDKVHGARARSTPLSRHHHFRTRRLPRTKQPFAVRIPRFCDDLASLELTPAPTYYSARAQDGQQEMERFKQQPSMLPGPAVPGCCLVSVHFLWAILSTSTVHTRACLMNSPQLLFVASRL